MHKSHLAAGFTLAFFLAGCASTQTSSRADSASVLSTARSAEETGGIASNRGQVASMWGDTHTSTLLFERAVAEDPSPLNKFNLAGAYQNEGREFDALGLYDQVSREGRGVMATTLAPNDDRALRNVRFNLAAAANARATASRRQASLTPTAATGDAVNTSTGPDVAPKIGLTPSEAAALDALENPL
jgi:hypothetical protein